jgi:hypothetical protein
MKTLRICRASYGRATVGAPLARIVTIGRFCGLVEERKAMPVIITEPTRRFARATAAPSRRAQAACAIPEWKTEAWAHRVEAEARKRMKAEIRGVGSCR